MIKHLVKLPVSLRELVILLLLTSGALLWAVPEPDIMAECFRVAQPSFAASVVEEHNATTAQHVQQLSELDRHEIDEAASAVQAKEIAAFQGIVTKIHAATLAHVAAAFCWLSAVTGLLILVRRGVAESHHRTIAARKGQPPVAGPLPRGMPAVLGGGRVHPTLW
jgi:hypothetical protein